MSMVITRDDSELMVYGGQSKCGLDGMWLNVATMFDAKPVRDEIGTLYNVSREEDGKLYLHFRTTDDERLFIEMSYEQQIAFTNGSIVKLYVW